MTRKELYIFDFDGTLGDTSGCIVASFQEALTFCGVSGINEREIVECMGMSLPLVFKKLTNNSLTDEKYNELVELYRDSYTVLLSDHTKGFPGVIEVLREIKERGAKIAIATSKKTSFAIKSCEVLGLDEFIDLYYGDDMVPADRKKPDPEMLSRIICELDVDVNDAVMIGDSDLDIIMGNALGMDTIAVTWGSHNRQRLARAEPVEIIDDVTSILA